MRINKNVLVIPYYIQKGDIKYCVFYRKDMSIWQFIAGGVEDQETTGVAAIRELEEETGIKGTLVLLDTIGSVPGHYFDSFRKQWDNSIFIVQCSAFAVETSNMTITLSDEHTQYKWVSYEDAMKALTFDFDKTALWELHERIKMHLFKT